MTHEIAGRGPPRISVIGYKGLSRLAHAVIPEYEGRASFEVVDLLFEGALAKARELERDESADVIVTAGGNAGSLRNCTSLPVIAIKITGFDILHALFKARAISDRVGIVTYLNRIPELDSVKEMLNLDILQRTYATADEAALSVKTLAREGCQVVIGSSVVIDQADQCGISSILIYSPDAVRQALNDALDVARFAQLEAARYDHLNAVLHSLHEAVLAVDVHGRITAINPVMERLLGVSRAAAIGSKVARIAPDLDMDHVLASGEQDLEQVLQIGQVTCIANRIPISEAGLRTGAVLTLQEAGTIQRAETSIRTQRRNRQLAARYRFDQLTGSSPSFVTAKQAAIRYARTDATLLVTGESGTGKELFAQSIHNASARRAAPFVAVNCAAFPESLLESEMFGYEEGAFTGSRKGGKPGLFEVAHTGTLFLDEIGDMPVSLQASLLRVLQEKEVMRLGSTRLVPVNVRIIAATNQRLTKRVEQGLFRADLYYRLNILHLSLPPLRDRIVDIPALALRLLHASLSRLGSHLPVDQALAPMVPALRAYRWPGNVRELENICERMAVAFSEAASLSRIDYRALEVDFPELFDAADSAPARDKLGPLPIASPAAPPCREVDDLVIRRVLAEVNNNRNLAAEKLGMSRTTLWRRIRSLGQQD